MASALPKEQYYHGDDLVTGEEGQIVEDLKQDKGTLVTLLRIVSIILFMLLAMVSICSHLKCLGLHSNTDIYSQLPTPLTYASYAYCIWCLILTLQGLGALYALFPGDEEKIRFLWALNVCLPFTWFCEILWLFALTHGELGLAMTFLSLATLSLFFGYIRLMSTDDCFQLLNNAIHEANHNHQQPQPSQQPYQRLPRFLLHYALYFAPTSLNLSWLVLTSLSEFMVILAHFELRAHLSWQLAVAFIAAAFLFAIVFLLWKKDLPIPLAMGWGFLAIAVEQVHAERAVAIACFGGCALLAVAPVGMGVAWAVLSCRRRKRLLQIQSLDAYHDDDDPWLGSYF